MLTTNYVDVNDNCLVFSILKDEYSASEKNYKVIKLANVTLFNRFKLSKFPGG